MNPSSSPNGNEKMPSTLGTSPTASIDFRRDRCHSMTNTSRLISPIAFFHDNSMMNETDFNNPLMDRKRRARAIATAPRRNRYDDDDDEHREKPTLFGLMKTSQPVQIPKPAKNFHSNSLPSTYSPPAILNQLTNEFDSIQPK